MKKIYCGTRAGILVLLLVVSLATLTSSGATFTAFRNLGYSGEDVDWSGNGNLVAIKDIGSYTYLIENVLTTPALWNSVYTDCSTGSGVVFSPDSSQMLVVGKGNPQEMAVVTLNYPSGSPSVPCERNDHGQIEDRACDWGDGRILTGRTNDPEGSLYDTCLNSVCLPEFDMLDDVMAVAFDKTNPSRFVIGSDYDDSGDNIKAGDTSCTTLWTHWTLDEAHVRSVAWYGSNVIVGDENGKIYRYSTSGGRQDYWTHGGRPGVTCAEFSPDGQWLATCGSTGIKIWSTSTWAEEYTGPSTTCVAWDPTSTYLVDNNGKLYAPFGPPPSVELTLYRISDTSGEPSTENPGNAKTLFEPRDTVRVTMRAKNTGPVSLGANWVLNIAQPGGHGSLPYPYNSDPVENNTNDKTIPNDGDWYYYSFDWETDTEDPLGSYDLLGAVRSASNWDDVLDDTETGANTKTLGPSAWLENQFTVQQFGTTVLTHGYQASGNLPDPNWPLTMAQAIRERAGLGRIKLYNKETGEFELLQPSDASGETILIFDWADESCRDYHGYSEAAGDALFAALIMGQQSADFSLDHLHFIGHSRGCVVNSETVERLIAAGYSVEQVTTLDPVDGGWLGICDDYDVNPSLGNVGVVSWEGIDWADNYYSYDDCQEGVVYLDGRYVEGAYNEDLSGRGTCVPPDFSMIGHTKVRTWYHGTVDLDATTDGTYDITDTYLNYIAADEWYGGTYRPRNEDGYNQSRIVNGTKGSMSGNQTPIAFSFEADGLVNGDFSRGPMLLDYLPFPGWSSHGGGGDGHIDDGYLELDWGNDWRCHNRFFVPLGATSIEFYYWVTDRTETGDELVVCMGEEIPANIIGTVSLDYEHSGWEACAIPVDKRGTIQTLTFMIVSGSSVSSEVRIDDVGLVIDSGGPPHDECANAIPILYGVPYDGSTASATGTDITSCTNNDTADVWHSFTPSMTGRYLISLEGSNYDTSLAVFDTCGGTELACNDNYYSGNVSRVIVDMVEGETYYIRISGYNGSTGDYTLVVSLAADVTKNGVVDFKDLGTFVDSWLLENIPSDVDIAPVDSLGELVNFLDYAVLAEYWHMDLTP